jgi:transglutaminase-like putative cysteine protease
MDRPACAGLFLLSPARGLGQSDEIEAARSFYDAIDHLRYSKEGTGWGNGDSVWACENGRGNCTDFHSLFLSLARSRRIPAKFEIGFGLPVERGSGDIDTYHCWAKFHLRSGVWVPVDISEGNKDPRLREYYLGTLTEDRVTFSTGRDLNLIPRQAGAPLNFFVYPYVEVDGKEHPPANAPCRFSFRDEEKRRQKFPCLRGGLAALGSRRPNDC